MDLSFNISPVSGFVGVTKFSFTPSGTSASIPGSQYFWNFGDFNYASNKEPQHVYFSPGTFSATLQVITPNQQSFNISQTVSTRYSGITHSLL